MNTFKGHVIRGDGRGRNLGFPTLNLEYIGDFEGVYVARVLFGDKEYKAVAHLGPRPTFNDAHQICELHLLNFDDAISYGDKIEVEFFDQIRGVIHFESVDELVSRIKEDVAFAKNWYNSREE